MKIIENHKWRMINNKGFALITMMFMLVTLISAVFLVAYVPISQERDISAQYLTDLIDRRIKRALFGRLAEQRGGKFSSCTGLYSDMGAHHGDVGGIYSERIFTKRSFYEKQYDNPAGGPPWPREEMDYKYDSHYGLWAGYRGNRYYYPSSCDHLEEPYLYDGLGHKFEIKTQCNRIGFIRYYFAGNFRTCMMFRRRHKYLIKLRDYTKMPSDRISIELASKWIRRDSNRMLRGPIKGSYTRCVTKDCGEYNLHQFLLEVVLNATGSDRVTNTTGLVKVIIRVDGNVVYTQPIVVPFWHRCKGPGRTVIDAYVEEIDYYG